MDDGVYVGARVIHIATAVRFGGSYDSEFDAYACAALLPIQPVAALTALTASISPSAFA